MRALIIVDVQNDFLPGGSLEVPKGDEVIPTAHKLQGKNFDLVVATQDWHPVNHSSFISEEKKTGMWPVHCVQETVGADFAQGLFTVPIKVVQKGTNIKIDSYSGFYDNDKKEGTDLVNSLRDKGIQDVYVMGLAFEYCVAYTALDASYLGYNVFFVKDGCRGLGDKGMKEAEKTMVDNDIKIITSDEV